MKLLFIPSTNPSVKVMSVLAAWLCTRGHDAALVANYSQQQYLGSVGAMGHEVLDFKSMQPVTISAVPRSGAAGSDSRSEVANHSRTEILVRLHQRRSSAAISLLACYWLLQILRFRWLWKRKVASLGVKAAFIWGDNAGTTNGELLNLLKAQGARLVHLPVALTDQKIIARLRVEAAVMRIGPDTAWLSRALAWLLPHQVLEHEGYRLFYFHPAEILAMGLLGDLPARPWVLGASRADFVCFSDGAQRDYWVARGLDAGKARIIGNLDLQDVEMAVARVRRSHPCLFKRPHPIVLFNMPNLVEHNVLRDWSEFWVEVRKMLAPFADQSVELVVSLHPKSDPANYAWLAETYGCLVTQGDIGAWINLSDLYVSLCSTTEILASDVGVPVVDIGPIYGFESDVLRALPNATFFRCYEDYLPAARAQLSSLSLPPRRFGSPDSTVVKLSPFERIHSLIETEITKPCPGN